MLAAASCGSTSPSGTTTKTSKPSSEKPEYGGEFIGVLSADIRTFDITTDLFGDASRNLTNERVIDGDWTKGPAGGYGTSNTL